jgi:hypothetical protein
MTAILTVLSLLLLRVMLSSSSSRELRSWASVGWVLMLPLIIVSCVSEKGHDRRPAGSSYYPSYSGGGSYTPAPAPDVPWTYTSERWTRERASAERVVRSSPPPAGVPFGSIMLPNELWLSLDGKVYDNGGQIMPSASMPPGLRQSLEAVREPMGATEALYGAEAARPALSQGRAVTGRPLSDVTAIEAMPLNPGLYGTPSATPIQDLIPSLAPFRE